MAESLSDYEALRNPIHLVVVGMQRPTSNRVAQFHSAMPLSLPLDPKCSGIFRKTETESFENGTQNTF